MLEEDYISRTIKDIARMMAKIVFRKDSPLIEAERKDAVVSGISYNDLIRMADAGEINEAENLLYDSLDRSKIGHFEYALSFYSYINEFSESSLEASDYSHLEIKDGLKTITEEFGLSWVDNIL